MKKWRCDVCLTLSAEFAEETKDGEMPPGWLSAALRLSLPMLDSEWRNPPIAHFCPACADGLVAKLNSQSEPAMRIAGLKARAK